VSLPASPEQEYFRRIEDTFIRLRGAPFLLSPSDWRLAQSWYDALIPVDLVCRALEEMFQARADRGAAGKVQSLRYCAAAVETAWRERRELGVAQARGDEYGMDVEARLATLAQALPSSLPGLDGWVQRIRAVGSEARTAESQLAQLDSELIDASLAGLEASELAVLQAAVEDSLAALRDRLAPEVLADDRRRLLRDRVRRHRHLPLLSLFSPDAVAS